MKHSDSMLEKIDKLMQAYQKGMLGGHKMPEDENPCLDKASKKNYTYFTLPMALNYQRNSYVLWECANKAYKDNETRPIFDTRTVCDMNLEHLQRYLVKYKVALQPNKQPVIWKTLCETIENQLDGDIRNLFIENEFSVENIKNYIIKNKRAFPYLGGNKICNYWLYVMEQYTDVKFTDRQNITVAPDTHVIQASIKLGVISLEEATLNNVQALVADRWQTLLNSTHWVPIDLHTPMWLWSRSKFALEI